MSKDAAAMPSLLAAAASHATPPRGVPTARGVASPNSAAPTEHHTSTQRVLGPQRSGRHTLFIEPGAKGTWRIIHTRPDGSREYWRRGIPTAEEAFIRAVVVEDLTGWELVQRG